MKAGHVDAVPGYPQVQAALWIGGKSLPAADGFCLDVADPSTGQAFVQIAAGGVDEAIAAVDAAEAAAPGWVAASPRDRAEVLRRAFELMTAEAERLADVIVMESGKSLADARGEVAYAAEFFRWFAEEAVRIDGQLSVAPSGRHRILTLQQPVGISLLVTPWNFPAAMGARKIAPALAAGCTTVVKPASETPLTMLVLADILERAGAPAGVVNVVPARSSSAVVSAMLADRRVRKLSFTGSTGVGTHLLAEASGRVLNCSMELGGNAPFVVFPSADVNDAVAGAMHAKMRNGGASCIAANRFLVHEGIAEEFARCLAAAMARLRLGPGWDPASDVGPLVSRGEREHVAGLVEAALDDGARARTGGAAPDRPGWYYAPTVLDRVHPDAAILSQEIFGPVAPIVTFATAEEALLLANNTDSGLAAYVYSGDLAEALRTAEALEVGMVGINRGLISEPAAPFGGVKVSGLGREGGHAGVLEFCETKYVAVDW
ncbi:MAG: succinate-semialdehyde dehdyrogenase [Frankiales bacterium]|jgi:succinate-semialdehyde dehydrogenase/glutarate-semialdehyde dehydrogenase|nr:succinate-semialdehyde dehdyrogenase [Frankiales bacterium]